MRLWSASFQAHKSCLFFFFFQIYETIFKLKIVVKLKTCFDLIKTTISKLVFGLGIIYITHLAKEEDETFGCRQSREVTYV